MLLDTRCRHNEAKYKILKLLYESKRYLVPHEIASKTGLTNGDIWTRLSKMHFQGYIWRRKVDRKGAKGHMYKYLKPMGIRVLMGTDGLEYRMRIRQVTGENITLNLKKQIPFEIRNRYRQEIMR